MLIPCPYLGEDVELTEERLAHIEEEHPDLLPEHLDKLLVTISEPDEVIPSLVEPKLLFSRWVATIGHGKWVVAVVLPDPRRQRHWIVTAYLTKRPPTGTSR